MLIIFILFFFLSVSTARADLNYHYLIEDNSIIYERDDTSINQDLIQDLLVVEEKDNSLTILFSVKSEDQEVKSYYLSFLAPDIEMRFCLSISKSNY